MSLTSTTKKDTNVVEFEIAVDAGALAKASEAVYRRKAKTISVPGFRKGKAPRKIIERMYGEGIFLEDAVNDLYPQAYSDAVEEAGIEPVDKADVEVISLDKNTGFTFKATVTVKPEVQVKDYKGIAAEKAEATVADAQVESEIDKMRERNARIITVEDRAAQLGDETVIDFEGFVDDAPFAGGKGEDFKLTLGSHSFIDNFEDQIVGHRPGDVFDVNVTFPEEYHAEELKGKPALFKVTLQEIKSKELPVVDDEFAKDVSEFDSLTELKADIRAKLQEAADTQAKNDLENKLVDAVLENLTGEIPECMYESRVDDMIRDFEYRLSAQGMQLNLYLQYTGMDMDAFRHTFREQAERQVKIRLALEKIAELEKLEVTPEELEAEYQKLSESYKMEADKLKQLVPEKDLTGDLRTNKAIDLIRDSAVITETEQKPEPEGEEGSAEADKDESATKKKPAAKKPAAKKPKAAKEAEPEGE